MAVKDWSVTPSANALIDGLNIAEDCPRENMNDMGRSIMAAVKRESQNVLSALALGAIGNGSTDDTTNFNSAYGALVTAGGGTFFLPPQYTFKVAGVLSSRLVDIEGGGMSASLITPATTTGVALRCTFSVGSWDAVTISGLGITGIGTREGVGIKVGPDTWSLNAEYVGRVVVNRVRLSNLEKGIERPLGNIGLWVEDAVFGSGGANDYHIFIKDNGSGSGDAMHGGNTTINNGHYENGEKAAIYVASNTIGSGQMSIENAIFENNPGYVFYIDGFNSNDGFPGISIRNCWNENNNTAVSVTVEGDTAAPVWGYFKDVPLVVAEDTPIGPLRLVNSHVLTENCDLSKLTAVTKDADSSVQHFRAHLFSGTAKGTVNSIGAIDNPSALNSPWFPMPRPTGYRFYNAPTTVHDHQSVTSYTGSAGVSTTNITNDPAMPNLPNVQELTITAGQTLYRAATFTVPASKYIVVRLLVRMVSGSSITGQVNGPSGTGGQMTISEAEWHTLTGIIKTGGSSVATSAVYYVNSSGGTSVIRIGYECIVPFDTAQEALNFANSGCVMATQKAAIAAPTGGATIDSQSRTAIDAIRAALTAHGIIG